MQSKHLSRDYYTDREGVTDGFTRLLNCFQASLYFILRNQRDIVDPYELFLQDHSFSVILNNEGRMKDIRFCQSWSCFEVVNTEDVKGRGVETFAEIEQWLDRGEIVLFETHSHRVPFHQDFISPEYPYDEATHNHAANHLFVALAHSPTELYYVEAPWLLRPDFVPYQNSKCVGVIQKKALQPAFDCFLHYRIVHIRLEGMAESVFSQRFLSVLKDISAHRCMPATSTAEESHYYNREGVEALIRCFEEGRIQLGRKSLSYVLKEIRLLEWRLSLIRQQKYMFWQSMRNQRKLFDSRIESGLEALRENVNGWEALVNKLRWMLRRKEYTYRPLLSILEKVHASEGRLTEELASLCQE